ncbi:MAG: T9SS type A sorting domain-containing protein [Bacteroidia bacterium]
MKKLIITALAFAPLAIFGQSAERQVIASAGGFTSTSGLQVSSTVGEAVIATGISSTIIVTQGFQQSNSSSVGIEKLEENGLSINVYPNPASEEVTLEIETKTVQLVKATIYDMLGKETGISVSNIRAFGKVKQNLNVASLVPGQYFILFTDDNLTLGTAQIQKVK